MRKVYVAISFIVGLSLIFAFILPKMVTRSSERVGGNQPQPDTTAEQPSGPEIRTDPALVNSISDGFLLDTGVDSEGIYTMGGVEIEEGQRFLELCLLKRDVDGHLIDLCVDNIAMIALTPHSFACNSTLREPSSRLRFAIGGKGPSARVLHLGAKYQITGIHSPDESRSTQMPQLNPTFTIPEDLPPHSVYKVELVVLDEQFNKRVAEEKAFERQQAVLENISVNLAKSFASDIVSILLPAEKSCFLNFQGRDVR